jgi:acyl-CoA synthetase (NDP forming)
MKACWPRVLIKGGLRGLIDGAGSQPWADGRVRPGGVYVELLKDVAFRLHPITDADAREMITETCSYLLLEGYRNAPKATSRPEATLQQISP